MKHHELQIPVKLLNPFIVVHFLFFFKFWTIYMYYNVNPIPTTVIDTTVVTANYNEATHFNLYLVVEI